MVKNVDIIETITLSALVDSILQSPEVNIKNMDFEELNILLKNGFGIAENSVCKVIEAIEQQIDMKTKLL